MTPIVKLQQELIVLAYQALDHVAEYGQGESQSVKIFVEASVRLLKGVLRAWREYLIRQATHENE